MPSSDAGPAARRIRRDLLRWFRAEDRRLPWRGTRDPYRVWISEVMLQQTTVEAVRRRYDAFLRRFPDVRTLALAREESVLAAWSGLGYYARARNLRRAAREIVSRHGGTIPGDPDALRRLPGFGPYTAAAVCAIAFDRRLPAAEANVTRIVARLFALPGSPATARHRREVLARVEEILPDSGAGDATSAFMDLGQGICTPRRPACGICPLSGDCAALRLGLPEAFPRRTGKPAPRRVAVAALFVERAGRALLVRGGKGLLGGLWQFPSGALEAGGRRQARIRLAGRARALGLTRERAPLATVRHVVVNRRLEIEVFRGKAPGGVPALPADARWFAPRELARAAIPTLTRKIARSVGFL